MKTRTLYCPKCKKIFITNGSDFYGEQGKCFCGGWWYLIGQVMTSWVSTQEYKNSNL